MGTVELQIFPDGIVYPGHPNAIALVVMHVFPSYQAASTVPEGKSYAPALTHQEVPGSGGNVYMGLEVVEELAKNGPEAAFALGNQLWRRSVGPGNFEEAYEKGQAQVDGVKGLFMETGHGWDASTQAQSAAAKIEISTPAVRSRAKTSRL